jgi:hypothetical protein
MSNDSLSKEQQVMVMMRKILGAVIRDTTPQPGMKQPLSENTINSIKDCFALIAAREKELAEEAGIENKMKPRYIDEPSASKVVPLSKIGKINSGKKPEDEA